MLQDNVASDNKIDANGLIATQGQRSDDFTRKSVNPFQFFASNRRKRSTGELNDQRIFNVPRPNGIFFPTAGKMAQSVGIPKTDIIVFLHWILRPIHQSLRIKSIEPKDQEIDNFPNRRLSPLDFFWGNRQKRSTKVYKNQENLYVTRKRFFLPWQSTWRKLIIPKANKVHNFSYKGLSSLDFSWDRRGKRSAKVMKDHVILNVPRPNGFFFLSQGKVSSSGRSGSRWLLDWIFPPISDSKTSKESISSETQDLPDLPEDVLDDILALYQILNSDADQNFDVYDQQAWPYMNLRFS